MITITNMLEVETYLERFGKLSAEGNPWFPSEQDRMLSAIYNRHVGKFMKGANVVAGKMYLAMESVTVYVNDYGNYFERGSLVSFENITADKADVSVTGDTFRVIHNGGFGNTPAAWSQYKGTRMQGWCKLDRIRVMELADALALLTPL